MNKITQKVIVTACIVAVLCFISPVKALSWPVCEEGGAVWVTERPTTEATFPGANLWWFCDDGSLNILGDAVDICVPHEEKKDATTKTVGDAVATERETVCGPKVADALCILLGFERSFHDDIKTEPAKPGEPVVSLTGDYCLRKGLYSKTLPSPSELESLEGEPCEKLSRLACIRTIDTIEASLALGMQELELDVLDPAPAEGTEIATGKKASELATEPIDDTEDETEVEQAEEQVTQTQTGPGRKMMQYQN